MNNLLIIVGLLFNLSLTAQVYKSPEEIDFKKDFFSLKASWMKKQPQAVIQGKTALHFKLVSKSTAMAGRGGQERTFATAYAMIEGISEETMQEIANEYYSMLNKKLSEKGYNTFEYETLKNASVYSKMMDKEKDREYANKERGVALTVTAFGGPNGKYHMGNIGYWGLYKNLSKETNAMVLNTEVIIDFANFDISLKRKYGLSYTETKSNATVFPEIIITPFTSADAGGNTIADQTQSGFSFLDKKGMSADIIPNVSIGFGGDFATSVDVYKNKMPKSMKRFMSFGSSLDPGTFVITVDDKKYKEAVLYALDKYIDLMLNKLDEKLTK